MREYWKKVHRRAILAARSDLHIETGPRMLLGVVSAIVVVIALAFWGSEGAVTDEIIMRTAVGSIVVMLLPFFYVWHLISEPPVMDEAQKETTANLRKLLKPKLEITWAYGCPYYIKKFSGSAGGWRYVCRIGVKNLSQTNQVEDVRAKIIKMHGDRFFDAPQTLQLSSGVLNGGEEKFWEIAEGKHIAQGDDLQIRLNVLQDSQYIYTVPDHRKVSIEVTAKGVSPVTRDFYLGVDDKMRLQFMPWGDEHLKSGSFDEIAEALDVS